MLEPQNVRLPVPAKNIDVKKDVNASEIERVASPEYPRPDVQNYDRIDAEVARYTHAARIDILEAESKRLRRIIDRRILTVMVATYFL